MEISVVTPTFFRYKEVPSLLESLSSQTLLPDEVILVDGAPIDEVRTQTWVEKNINKFPFKVRYFRESGGTAIQRNYGIARAKGRFIAFFDDDVRPDPMFLEEIVGHFNKDKELEIGGITGVKRSHYFDMFSHTRWVWYKRLKLLTTFIPSAYDRVCGYPINASAQPPFSGIREVDIMTGACTVYRSLLFKGLGAQFNPFFRDFGILEDAHLALSIQKLGYRNLQCGDATCIELNSESGRRDVFTNSKKTCLNYYYVFNSICGPLSISQKFRFFRFQCFELLRFLGAVLTKRDRKSTDALLGKISGVFTALVGWEAYLKKVNELE